MHDVYSNNFPLFSQLSAFHAFAEQFFKTTYNFNSNIIVFRNSNGEGLLFSAPLRVQLSTILTNYSCGLATGKGIRNLRTRLLPRFPCKWSGGNAYTNLKRFEEAVKNLDILENKQRKNVLQIFNLSAKAVFCCIALCPSDLFRKYTNSLSTLRPPFTKCNSLDKKKTFENEARICQFTNNSRIDFPSVKFVTCDFSPLLPLVRLIKCGSRHDVL